MSKYLYPIYKLKTKSYIRWWLYNYLGKFNNYVLSEILTGTSFYLEDSTDRKFNIFDMIGRTTQESTTGKNYWDNEQVTTTGIMEKLPTGFKITKSSSSRFGGTYLVNLPAEEYKFYGNIKTNAVGSASGFIIKYEDDTTSTIPYTRILDHATIAFSKNIVSIQPYINGSEDIGVYYEITDFMILSASETDTSYEPYTGGEPAPNPNYPMAIKNTGDNGSVNEKVSNSDGTQEQNISFPLAEGQKLYQDEELKENGKDDMWGEIVFTGIENYDWKKSSYYSGSYYFYPNDYGLDYKEYSEFKCSHAICVRGASNYAIGKCLAESAMNLWLDDGTQLPTPTAFKAYLAEQYANGTPVTIVYKKANPTITPYTEEQQRYYDEHIKPLRTYKNVTHISSEDETPAELKIQYWKEV